MNYCWFVDYKSDVEASNSMVTRLPKIPAAHRNSDRQLSDSSLYSRSRSGSPARQPRSKHQSKHKLNESTSSTSSSRSRSPVEYRQSRTTCSSPGLKRRRRSRTTSPHTPSITQHQSEPQIHSEPQHQEEPHPTPLTTQPDETVTNADLQSELFSVNFLYMWHTLWLSSSITIYYLSLSHHLRNIYAQSLEGNSHYVESFLICVKILNKKIHYCSIKQSCFKKI